MPSAKLYEFSTKDPMDVPLPEMARKVLECQSDKVYKCYKEDNEFDFVIGAKNEEEVKEACGGICEVIDFHHISHWGGRPRPNKFEGYKCFYEKSHAVYRHPHWFRWKDDRLKPEDRLKPKDILLEDIMRLVHRYQDDTIFKIQHNSNVVVIAGTSDKDLAKRVYQHRWLLNPTQEDLDYVEKNLNVWE